MQKRDPRSFQDIKTNNINRLEMDDKSLFLRKILFKVLQNPLNLMIFGVFCFNPISKHSLIRNTKGAQFGAQGNH